MSRRKKLSIIFAIVFSVSLIVTGSFLLSSFVQGAWTAQADVSTLTDASVTVTPQKSTKTPAAITGASIVYPEIPTAVGKKGTKTNPFVVLEVVPHKAYQTLSYLVAGSEPFSVSEMEGKITDDNYFDNNIRNSLPLFTYLYNVYNPAKKAYENQSPYSVNKVEYKIMATSYTSNDFVTGCESYGISPTQIPETQWKKSLFYDPQNNYQLKKKKVSGYFVCTDNDKGNYNSQDKKWIFSETKPDSGNSLSPSTLSSAVKGDYYSVTDYEIPVLSYTYTTYKIKNNDVLKHKLFKFDTEEAYTDFNMKVIVVTPEQVNDMLKADTSNTMDYIERADMIYMSQPLSIKSQYFSFYFNWDIDGRNDPNKLTSINTTFSEHDIEWDGIMKILDRLSDDENLPLLIHSNLYSQAFKTSAHKYYYQNQDSYTYNRPQCQIMSSTTTNVAKLFLIAGQFNLERDGYFMKNYYSQLKKVRVNDPKAGVNYLGAYADQELCKCSISEEQKKENFYAWNLYTFYPFRYIPNDQLTNFGYLTAPYTGMNLNHEFVGREEGEDTNYNVVGLNDNRSFDESDLFNKQGTVLYEILNGMFTKTPVEEEELKPLEIVVKNTISSGSELSMFVDLDKRGTYSDTNMLSIPFKVINENEGLDEIVSVVVKDDKGSEKNISFNKKSDGTYVMKYPCKEFTKDYTKIVITASVKSDSKEDTQVKTVNLVERELFDLE